MTIVSSDKDLMQLIDGQGQVDMLDTMNDRRIDRDQVIEKFGVPPEQVGDVLALMGDSVDNVPGIRGIGPKTATKLIQDHGSLEGALAAAPTMKPSKMQQSLIDQADMARLSRELVRLVCEHPLPEPLDTLMLTGIPPEPLRAFLEDQGFKTLQARMVGGPGSGGGSGGASAGNVAAVMTSSAPKPLAEPEKIVVDRTKYETVTTREAARQMDRRRAPPGLRRDRHRDRLHRLHRRQAGRDQPGDRAQRGLLHPGRATAAATCFPMPRRNCREPRCWAR